MWRKLLLASHISHFISGNEKLLMNGFEKTKKTISFALLWKLLFFAILLC